MKRKVMKWLIDWKNSSNRKPLILQGARQVGKTYSALSFGKEYYDSVVYFNFENNRELIKIFERDLDPERIIRELSINSGKSILKEKTLIFFDEIQACERALTSLKYFNENANEYHIIAAGSLLGVAVNREQYSFPVGKVDLKTLYPLDFEEFLMAINEEKLIELIKESFEKDIELSIHNKAMDLYKIYLVVGGMPAAVKEYIDKKDFDFVLATQKSINDSYVADMAKYATPHETTRIMATFNSIPAQLAKENKKFQYKVIKSGARAHEYETPVEWLRSSGVILKCTKCNEGKLPLAAYSDFNSFKVYITDTGLLCSKFGIPANAVLSDGIVFNDFKGALTENYVCFSLNANGYTPYYWESKGSAEVDFLIQDKDGYIIPIEVKAAEHVRAKSLQQYIKKYQPKYAIRISGKNFGFENGIKSVPLYATFLI
ncbi:ATP-binding protein [Clostridium botulinum]|uniref:ATPase n=2 Tax=Clostridium TaxID=1485 RepID=A0A0A0HUI7_CLONO|nr:MULTISPECIES: ATP-binding protein [Clostridium]KEI04424.1 ATPase [Clostridium botulinum C/D str. BKT75002]KEI11333.1 ATPase [Clostridium botulinum C/D str. BKT2873]KGM92849.1 ATPase [Clostridium novyi A str. 4552]KGM97198.1 ATPase [Clostridium botulinum C/D str. DC5]KOC55346.1 ATPase [Clostridium botulinum]